MKKVQQFIFLSATVFFALMGCKKTDTYSSDLNQYLPMQSGKSITYRLDSTTFTNFGLTKTTTSYTVQDIIDTTFTDNLGRLTWRVLRYITDTSQTQPWANLETIAITPTLGRIEVVENNLRYVKLALPLNNGASWLGNSYINTNSPSSTSDPDYSYLANWNYTYDSIGANYTVLQGSIPNTLIVRQQNNVSGDTTDKSVLTQIDYSIEVYAKGIGLIYKNFLHQENQPPNADHSQPYSQGYGIRLNMIDHN
jgi:hypothetical protein